MFRRSKYPTTGTTLDFKNYQAVGSITSGVGLNKITLTSNPGFQVNDYIIVEVGGEAGAGLRGTMGVGGTWPALSYADATARAAGTPAANTYAWQRDTGDVWRYDDSVWTQIAASDYYIAKAIPKALCARITGIAGLVLTLDATASTETTAANVYYDNERYWDALGQSGSGATPTDNTYIIPAGSFAFGSYMRLNDHNGWTLRGQGMNSSELFSPRGCPSLHLSLQGCDSITVRDFAVRGNAKLNGFGLAWYRVNASVSETSVAQGDGYPRGVYFVQNTGGLAHRIKVTDAFQVAIGTSSSDYVWAKECQVYVTDPIPRYIQWQLLWADSTGGGTIDCSIDCNYLTGGCEIFRSDKVSHIRPTLRNCSMSCNSAGQWLLDEPTITFEALTQYSEGAHSESNPIINVNANIQPPSRLLPQGGIIRNPRITVEGYMNATNDMPAAIVVNNTCDNVSILGGYHNNPENGGLIDYQVDYASPGNVNYSCVGIINDNAKRLLVDGIRVIGTVEGSSYKNINCAPSSGIVRNCVADQISGSAVASNNQTNAEYEAL
jgi:hypothetical protein